MVEPSSGEEYKRYLRLLVPSVVAALEDRGHSPIDRLDAYTLVAGLIELRLKANHTEIILDDLETVCSSTLTDEHIHKRLSALETIGIVERQPSHGADSYRLFQPFGWTRYPMLEATATEGELIPGDSAEPESVAVAQSTDPSLLPVAVSPATQESHPNALAQMTTRSSGPTQYAHASNTASTAAMISGVGGFSLVFVAASPVVPTVLWAVMWFCLCLWAVTAAVDRLACRWGDPAEWFLKPAPRE